MVQINDAREIETGAVLETDLAIVGAGPAGLTLTDQFRGTHVQLMLFEGGGLVEDAQPASDEFECTGQQRKDFGRVRNRAFGGSSISWSGKCRTFDAIDFEHRDWVPFSGWPLSKEDLEVYETRAAAAMNLGPNVYGDELLPLLGINETDKPAPAKALETCFWQFARELDQPLEFLRFGARFLKQQPADNIQVFVNGTVTHLGTNANGSKLTEIEVTCAPGKKFKVIPRVVVLAAGGIENPRLLLASNRIRPAGVGNDNDTVGRFLLDHPQTSLGEFGPEAARLAQAKLGLFQLKHRGRRHFYTRGLALGAAEQRQKYLLNCAAYISEYRAEDDPWDAIKRLYRRQTSNFVKDVQSFVTNPLLVANGVLARSFRGRNVVHKIDKIVVDCLVEQLPDPESRLSLSTRRDATGLPLTRLHWKISEMERRTVAEMARLVADEVVQLGLPPLTPPEWLRDGDLNRIEFTDFAHPTGATRMSSDPRQGVVDKNCRLHTTDGLYVAGSSVFPTASHANPTLMIVAMTMRLADWLKQRHFARSATRDRHLTVLHE